MKESEKELEKETTEEINEGSSDDASENTVAASADETAKDPLSDIDEETLSKNKRAIIFEIVLAIAAVAVIVIAIVIKQNQKPAEPVAPDAEVSAENEMIQIDNSVLFEGVPAIPSMIQNEDLDYDSLVSEGKMLKLTGPNGEEVYVHNYTNSTYFNNETVLDEKELDALIVKNVLSNYLEPEEANRDTAQMYDTVSINYVGTMDGVAFEGGTANDQELTIGVSAFIDGFTEGIVGMKVGETKDVHVTFPADYHSADLAGKPAVFAITLNQIITGNKVPELTDEMASTITGGELTKAADLRDYYRKSQLSVLIWDFIDTDFHINSISDDLILSYYNKLLSQLDKSSQTYQMSAESLISMSYGMDIEAYKEQMMAEAVESMRHAVLYNAIGAKEGIDVSEEDILKLAADYGYADNVQEFKDNFGEDMIHDYILQSNLMDYFITLHK